ncbi:hypothetical protein H8D30_05975 [bacterium]|nr:hypothetical protein [bacterium]
MNDGLLNRGCAIGIGILCIIIFVFVGRAGNLQSVLSRGNPDAVLTRIEVERVQKIEPSDVNGSLERFSLSLSIFAGIPIDDAEEIVVAGPLLGEFRGGIVMGRVERSEVDWLGDGQAIAVITCGVSGKDCFDVADSPSLYADYIPELLGVGLGGKWLKVGSSAYRAALERSVPKGIVWVVLAVLREPGLGDRKILPDGE